MFHNLFSKKSIIDCFWDWFKKNDNAFFYFEQNQNFLFNCLKSQLNKIHSDLVFEFSPILQDGRREFVISADGIESIFHIVNDIVNKAPKLNKWHIVAFRQPRKGITQITYDNLTVNFDDVFFRYGKDNGHIALELNIRNFYESPEWTGAAFILLDNILGEYYTATSLSRIEKKLLNEQDIKNLHPIKDLPKIVQSYHLEWSN